MKVAYKMFNYGNNTYRFVSKEPLEVGDTIKINDIGINGNFSKIIKVVELRQDYGDWEEPMLTNVVIVSSFSLL
jgi:hypothetical protein